MLPFPMVFLTALTPSQLFPAVTRRTSDLALVADSSGVLPRFYAPADFWKENCRNRAARRKYAFRASTGEIFDNTWRGMR
jgi:hypothetical protein